MGSLEHTALSPNLANADFTKATKLDPKIAVPTVEILDVRKDREVARFREGQLG